MHRGTASEQPCRNYADTCPFMEHRRLVVSNDTTATAGDAKDAARAAAIEAFVAVPKNATRLTASGEARRLPIDVEAELRRLVMADTALTADQIEKDYWLHAALLRLNTRGIGIGCGIEEPPRWGLRGLFRGRQRRAGLYDVMFAGGTALVSQWDLSERFSEDIDLIIVNRSGVLGKAETEHMSRTVADVCTDAITDRSAHDWEPRNERPHPMQVQGNAARNNIDDYARIDVTESSSELSPWANRPVMSLMGRYASVETRREFPELGGFSLPSLHFTVTIGNKMRANVDNVDHGRLDKLAERARDLFDIASAASDSDARDAIIEHIRACSIVAESPRTDAASERARAVFRFSDSRSLQRGTEEYDALGDGYRRVAETLVWRPDQAPDFMTAVDIARTLRLDD